MKLWSVQQPGSTGSFITFEVWQEREAREWMREHQRYIQAPGSYLYGAELVLVEFESEDERIRREHAEMKAALKTIGGCAQRELCPQCAELLDTTLASIKE